MISYPCGSRFGQGRLFDRSIFLCLATGFTRAESRRRLSMASWGCDALANGNTTAMRQTVQDRLGFIRAGGSPVPGWVCILDNVGDQQAPRSLPAAADLTRYGLGSGKFRDRCEPFGG